jgi:hypothetical protein
MQRVFSCVLPLTFCLAELEILGLAAVQNEGVLLPGWTQPPAWMSCHKATQPTLAVRLQHGMEIALFISCQTRECRVDKEDPKIDGAGVAVE